MATEDTTRITVLYSPDGRHFRRLAKDQEDAEDAVTEVGCVAVEYVRADVHEQVERTITKCRESAGMAASPDGLTGDVTNLLARGDLAEHRAERLADVHEQTLALLRIVSEAARADGGYRGSSEEIAVREFLEAHGG